MYQFTYLNGLLTLLTITQTHFIFKESSSFVIEEKKNRATLRRVEVP